MKLIGVELSTPKGPQFTYFLRWTIIMLAIGLAAYLLGFVDLHGAKNVALGGIGSAFAMACGADTDKYGWRAWVVMISFALAASAAVNLIIELASSV